MNVAGWVALLPTQNSFAADLLAQVSGILLLLAAGVLIYRALGERYLLGWTIGWAFYLLFRIAGRAPSQDPHAQLWAALAHASYGLAIAGFVTAVLLYSNRNRWLLPLGIVTAINIDLAIMRSLWWPGSQGLLVVVYLLWTALCVAGAAVLSLFSRGRRSIGPWLLTIVLLLLPTANPDTPGLFADADLVITMLLGLSILLIVLEDTTARNRRLAVINTITAAVARAHDFGPMMSIALEELRRLMFADAAWFRIVDGEQLVLTNQIGLGAEYLKSRAVLDLHTSFTGSVIRGGRPRLLRASDSDPTTRRRLQHEGLDHVLVVPVGGKNTVIGALALGTHTHRSYTSAEVQFLSDTTQLLGIAVENLRMFDQILYSQRQWVNTFDSIQDYILVHDQDGKIVRLNRALSERIGLSPAEAVDRTCAEALPHPVGIQGCAYCAHSKSSGSEAFSESVDPCFGGYAIVSTYSYSEDGSSRLGTIHIIRDASERRLAEQRYKLLFDGVQEGAFISTPQGQVIDCNDAFVRMLGYDTREEVLTLDIANQMYVHADHRQRFREAMETEGFVRNYEVDLRRKDGGVITALESSFATRDAAGNADRYQGVLLDITEQKRAEEELRRRNRELAVLNSVAAIATESFDLEKILNLTLQQVVEVVGADTAAVYLLEPGSHTLRRRARFGRYIASPDLLHEVQVPEVFMETVKAGHVEIIPGDAMAELPPQVVEFIRQEGFQSWLWVVLWGKDLPIGLLGVTSRSQRTFSQQEQDLLVGISRQLAMTVEKARLYEETCQAYDNLSRTQEQLLQSEKMSAVGQLISGVAHELNNPLTAILGYAQLLENEPLNERGLDFAKKIFRQAQRTHRVVQNLLSFARQRKPEKLQVELQRVLEDTVLLRDYDLKLNNIVIERHFDDNLPPVVADANQMEQVFLNIINNAADAMLEGSRGGVLRVRVFAENNQLVAEFHDSGPGVKDVKRIFDPFFTTKKVGKGTGLGLSICYGIVKEHGGEITAGNHPQGGAVFQVRLPAVEAAAETKPQAAPRVNHAILAGRVLLVDDEETVLEFEREVLRGAGAHVVTLNRGEDAIATLQKENFDAVVLDGKMPGGWTGFDIYRWLVEHRPGLEERVILTLSNIDDLELRSVLKEREISYLIKPFEVAELIAAVRRVLERDRATAVRA
jgi:PAS domain S-box-containing protein